MKYFETILDLETGMETLRELSDDEIKDVEKRKAENTKVFDEKAKIEAAKAVKKADLLERLGLTDDEFKTLIS